MVLCERYVSMHAHAAPFARMAGTHTCCTNGAVCVCLLVHLFRGPVMNGPKAEDSSFKELHRDYGKSL